jgi:hypothetical protein
MERSGMANMAAASRVVANLAIANQQLKDQAGKGD